MNGLDTTSASDREQLAAHRIQTANVPTRVYATGRDESEACEANTPGCAIDHARDNGSCEGW